MIRKFPIYSVKNHFLLHTSKPRSVTSVVCLLAFNFHCRLFRNFFICPFNLLYNITLQGSFSVICISFQYNISTLILYWKEMQMIDKKKPNLNFTWKHMMIRCYIKSHLNYKYYSAKGVTVAER